MTSDGNDRIRRVSSPSQTIAPIFVVGCPRSGTTLIRAMLDRHPNLSCGPETLLLDAFAHLEKRRWQQLRHFGIDREQWRMQVRDLFTWVHSQRAEREGKGRWVDKTPGYALILDFIDDLYPDCQVVHVVRDPHDVIDSWRRRLGPIAARGAVTKWPQHVRAARSFRDSHPADRFTEIRYEDLVSEPRKVMEPLLDWLHEPWNDEIIDLSRPRAKRANPQPRTARWSTWIGSDSDDDEAAGTTPPPTRWQKGRSSSHRPAGRTISTDSVGAGRRGASRLINAPYFLELHVRSKDLLRELGY
jgi:Sulfotransferase family